MMMGDYEENKQQMKNKQKLDPDKKKARNTKKYIWKIHVEP